jgi:dynamin 1-like protein
MAAATLASLGAAIAKLKSLTSQYDLDIKLPGLIVIGSQSVGKSSVLQAIVGLKEQILPSGDGVVTRVPINLQLRGCLDVEEPFVTFEHSGGNHFSLQEASQEIMRWTASKCPGRDVRDVPLSMTIHKQGLVDLMLTDLPGLTEIAVEGQPQELPETIEDIVRSYARRTGNILVAVSAASADIATSKALKIAREVDPRGERSIGIFTKMDMLTGDDAIRKTLDNRQYPLAHGYFGIICRQSTPEARRVEEEAFVTSHGLDDVVNFGTDALVKRLGTIYRREMTKQFPEIQDVLLREKRAAEDMLKTLRDTDSEEDRLQRGIRICQRVDKCLKDVLSGSPSLVLDHPDLVDLYGVVTLRDIHKRVRSQLQSLKLLGDGDWEQKVEQRLMANAGGTNTDVSMTLDIIKELLSRRVSALLPPICTAYADSISKAVRSLVQNFLPTVCELSQYPVFRQRIVEVLMEFLQEGEAQLRAGIADYIKQEVNYINLLEGEDDTCEFNQDGVLSDEVGVKMKRPLAALASYVFGKQKGSELLKTVVNEYEKRLQICVPHFVVSKAEYCLILPLKAHALTKLLSEFTKNDTMLELIPEDRSEAQTRKEKRQKIDHINSTLKELGCLL